MNKKYVIFKFSFLKIYYQIESWYQQDHFTIKEKGTTWIGILSSDGVTINTQVSSNPQNCC